MTALSGNSDDYLNQLAASRLFWEQVKARPEQLPDNDDWQVWLYLAGRGAGKTRMSAEWVVWNAIRQNRSRWAVVAPTFGDARDTCAEGESGLISIIERYRCLKTYNRSTGEIRLKNGSIIKLFSAQEPDRLRGPQFHGAWCDELCAWDYEEAWDMLQFGLRLGTKPQIVISTTPKPTPLIKALSSRDDGSVRVVRGSTFDNAANLAPSALKELRNRYEGTRLGRQELYAELLLDTSGALWTYQMVEEARTTKTHELTRVVVAIDPALTSHEDSDETGIIVVGKTIDGKGIVLADRTCKDSPLGWARRAVAAYEEFGADRIIAEENAIGESVETIIRQVAPHVAYKGVRAYVGKRLRAEPIAALYEQGRVLHAPGLEKLETQMTEWLPDSGYSPDRLDAMVHGMTALGIGAGNSADVFLQAIAPLCLRCNHPNTETALTCDSCGHRLREAPSADNYLTMTYPRG